ncbi:hypothetical protein BD626DRAFT_28239 [Schizophyllum amplum]|uniref:Uncharacterized protein n=1 Tax=Schizophyllum amplum TaxID=97359 RepID=A0A550D047_9AGAR|nr:hypothetical protein BD626DRAFT_28239 [Auriculariopsis ampla]
MPRRAVRVRHHARRGHRRPARACSNTVRTRGRAASRSTGAIARSASCATSCTLGWASRAHADKYRGRAQRSRSGSAAAAAQYAAQNVQHKTGINISMLGGESARPRSPNPCRRDGICEWTRTRTGAAWYGPWLGRFVKQSAETCAPIVRRHCNTSTLFLTRGRPRAIRPPDVYVTHVVRYIAPAALPLAANGSSAISATPSNPISRAATTTSLTSLLDWAEPASPSPMSWMTPFRTSSTTPSSTSSMTPSIVASSAETAVSPRRCVRRAAGAVFRSTHRKAITEEEDTRIAPPVTRRRKTVDDVDERSEARQISATGIGHARHLL